MKFTPLTIVFLYCLCAGSATSAATTSDNKKPVTSKQKIEALTSEQKRLRQIVEIQQRQLQEMSQRFNATRSAEPISNLPYTYP